MNTGSTTGLEIVNEFFYTNTNNIVLATINEWYCWPEFTVLVGETLDFNSMSAIYSQNDNINFTANLRKDGTVVAETGIYDADKLGSGTLMYKGRVTGSNSNFRFCI